MQKREGPCVQMKRLLPRNNPSQLPVAPAASAVDCSALRKQSEEEDCWMPRRPATAALPLLPLPEEKDQKPQRAQEELTPHTIQRTHS